MLMALVLSREECIWALRAFLLSSVLGLLLIVLHHIGILPDAQLWRAITHMQGNKSINDALLFATIGAGAAVLGLAHLSKVCSAGAGASASNNAIAPPRLWPLMMIFCPA